MHSTHDEVDLRLRVAGRTTVADGVVVLDLRAPGRRRPAGLGSPARTSTSLPDRPHPPVLAVRRPGGPRRLADRGAARARGPRRLGVRARRAGRGRPTSRSAGPRNHFPLGPVAALPLRRGRHRHHPDPADDRRGRGGGATGSCTTAAAAALDGVPGVAGRRRPARGDAAPPGRGRPDRPRRAASAAPAADTLVYCCGPEPLLAAVEQRCAAWPAGSLHVERFAPRDVGEPVLTGAFEVELALSGLSLTVPPEQSSWRSSRTPGSACCPPARKGPAAPARPTCCRAWSTTGTRC